MIILISIALGILYLIALIGFSFMVYLIEQDKTTVKHLSTTIDLLFRVIKHQDGNALPNSDLIDIDLNHRRN